MTDSIAVVEAGTKEEFMSECNHSYFSELRDSIREARENYKEDPTETNREVLRLAEEAFEEALRYEQ